MFTCTNCDYTSSTKLGKCPSCNEFGSFVMDGRFTKEDKKSKHEVKSGIVLEYEKDKSSKSEFFGLTNTEFKRVLTSGVKAGGIYLLGGAPGIGKSTIILQIMQDILSNNQIRIGYFTGEEQENQVYERFCRLAPKQDCFPIFHSTHLEDIISTTQNNRFDLIIVDSIQTIYSEHTESSAGSPNQVKYCAEKVSEYCKKNGCTAFIIGHVTKGGEIAGPKYLEHIVDVVMYLEGDRFGQLRFLRSQKNRFGNTDDSGIFEMTLFGLRPVYDLKERILQSANTTIPGTVLTVGLDNGRPVLTSIEVLLNRTKYKFPEKNCIGVSQKRVDLVCAILERYLKLNLGVYDIFVNIPGEFSFLDSGLDLAIAFGIRSQYNNKMIDKKMIFLGELGLGGQVVKTKLHEKRSREVPEGFAIIDLEAMKNIVQIRNIV